MSGALNHAKNRRASRVLADDIPGARLVVMADCGHVPPLEEPEAFAQLLRSFHRDRRGIILEPRRLRRI